MQTFYRSSKSQREVSSRLCLFNSCHSCQFPLSYWFPFETNTMENIYAIKTPALKQNLNYNLLFSWAGLLTHLPVTQPICFWSCFAPRCSGAALSCGELSSPAAACRDPCSFPDWVLPFQLWQPSELAWLANSVDAAQFSFFLHRWLSQTFAPPRPPKCKSNGISNTC